MIESWELHSRFGKVSIASGLAIFLFFFLFPQGAGAQAEQVAEANLSSDLSIPGGDSFLSLTLNAEGVQVGKVVSEITFPKDVLSFVEAKRGESGDQAEADVKAEVKAAAGNSKDSVLQVTVSAAKALPLGILATLKFKVSGAAPETDVTLKNAVKIFSLSGQEIKSAKGNEAILTVSPATLPSVGCFLFTH